MRNRDVKTDRAVRTTLMIVSSPILQFFARICKCQVPMSVQTLGAIQFVDDQPDEDSERIEPPTQENLSRDEHAGQTSQRGSGETMTRPT